MNLARDTRVLEALARLKAEPEFAVVMGALKEEMVALYADMTTCKDEVSLRWLQGAAQTVFELVELAENANEIVHRMQQK